MKRAAGLIDQHRVRLPQVLKALRIGEIRLGKTLSQSSLNRYRYRAEYRKKRWARLSRRREPACIRFGTTDFTNNLPHRTARKFCLEYTNGLQVFFTIRAAPTTRTVAQWIRKTGDAAAWQF